VKFLLILVLLMLLAAGAGYYILTTPYGPQSESFVDIPIGSSTHAIAIQMEKNGIIRTQYAFAMIRLYRTWKGLPTTLKAGEYRFDHPATPLDVYSRLDRGDVYTVTLSVPPGYNIFDIAAAVEATHLGTAADFLAAAREHTELITPWLQPNSPRPASLEGYLFPDTYHLSRHATPLQILTTMTRRFRQALNQLDAEGDHVTDVPHTVLMASLIEKEVSQDSERPLVAGVFVNRLAKNMPLATDPTVIYAALLDNRWRGTIYASDLQSPSPYNTYRHTGLPPGPICSPGFASLRAAIHPAQTGYLYFVADANGHSRFSTTLKEHNAAVQSYREAVGESHPAPTPPAKSSRHANANHR
jgi:UPF0755 protein